MSGQILVGCDVGLKRIGLALYTQETILPMPAILRHNRDQARHDLKIFLENKRAAGLVVGLPNACYADTRARVQHFIEGLDFAPIFYVDEDDSSTQAQERIFHLSYKQRQKARKNGILDSLAACILLERYLGL